MHTHRPVRFDSWQVLYLNNNKISDSGMVKFAESLGKGALVSLMVRHAPPHVCWTLKAGMHTHRPVHFDSWQELRLYENQVGDEGMVKFAEALGNGALASLTVRQAPPLAC